MIRVSLHQPIQVEDRAVSSFVCTNMTRSELTGFVLFESKKVNLLVATSNILGISSK